VPAAQPVAGALTQAPEALSQQTPHAAAQVEPLPLYRVPVGQPVIGALVQAPVVLLQQTPQGVAHVEPLPWYVVPVGQPVAGAVVHAPDPLLQQTPQVAAHVPPQVNVFGAAHAAGATMVHAPVVEEQQRPVQGLGVQTEPGPWYVVPPGQPFAVALVQAQEVVSQQTPQGVWHVPQVHVPPAVVQSAWDNKEQAPVMLQHEPGQVFTGLQVVFGRAQVHVPVQLGSVVTVHTQLARQQRPLHGLGLQAAPQYQSFRPWHWSWIVMVQWQRTWLQHAPAQGLGAQIVPHDHVPLIARHAAWVVRVQEQVVEQQMPLQGAGEQERPQVQVPKQFARVVEVQRQRLSQHAPVQGLGSHTPAQVQTAPGPVHPTCAEILQMQPLLQQDPWQGLGEQETPSPR